MARLYDYLVSKGVAGMDRWSRLTYASSIRPDGKVIGGSGVAKDVLGTWSFSARLP